MSSGCVSVQYYVKYANSTTVLQSVLWSRSMTLQASSTDNSALLIYSLQTAVPHTTTHSVHIRCQCVRSVLLTNKLKTFWYTVVPRLMYCAVSHRIRNNRLHFYAEKCTFLFGNLVCRYSFDSIQGRPKTGPLCFTTKFWTDLYQIWQKSKSLHSEHHAIMYCNRLWKIVANNNNC